MGDVGDKVVAVAHGVEQGGQVQVPGEVVGSIGQRPRGVEVPASIHEERLHAPIRFFRSSYVSPYFWAIATACALPSAGPRTTLNVRSDGSSCLTVLTMLTVAGPIRDSSSRKVTYTQMRSRPMILRMILSLR